MLGPGGFKGVYDRARSVVLLLTGKVLIPFDWLGRVLHISSRWAASAGPLALFGLAFGLIGVHEYAAAVAVWVVLAIVLAAKAIQWRGPVEHPLRTKLLKSVWLLAAMTLVPQFLVVWTQDVRGDKAWTNLDRRTTGTVVSTALPEQQSAKQPAGDGTGKGTVPAPTATGPQTAKPPLMSPLEPHPGLADRPKEGRRLAPWQKVTITAALAEHAGQHSVLWAYPDEETRQYARDFREALLAARWVVDGPRDAPKDQAALEVQLFQSDHYWTHNAPVQYLKLRQVLQAAGVSIRKGIQVMPDVEPEEIVVWIGPPAPAHYDLEDGPPPVSQMPCRKPVAFDENRIDPPASSKGKYATVVTITAPDRPRVGNRMRLYLTAPATDVGSYESSPVKIDPTPTVMPRNDVLDIEPAVFIKPGGRIPVVIVCEQECHVKCVEDLGRR